MWIEREDGKEMVGIKRGGDMIYRQDAIDAVEHTKSAKSPDGEVYVAKINAEMNIQLLPPAQPDHEKYEYHYDHTDCIWYRPEARNRCPSTCSQYRDGWNDAMNYIFRDGKGYRPYRRGERYE